MVPLPITMHTGQIILLAKMFTEVDLEFYDFKGGAPVMTWRAKGESAK